MFVPVSGVGGVSMSIMHVVDVAIVRERGAAAACGVLVLLFVVDGRWGGAHERCA